NIVYALRLKNISSSECSVSGLPLGRLLGRRHNPLPTHVKAAFPQGLTAILVRLQPGQWTKATARFSPDVPGPGEPVAGRQCEPVAYTLLVRPNGGGALHAPIRPPTSVCEHGGMTWAVLTQPWSSSNGGVRARRERPPAELGE